MGLKLIDDDGRLFGRFNVIDTLTTGVIMAGVLGFFLVQSGYHETSGQIVEGETDIRVVVQISNLKTLDPDLFVEGQETSITIRNQPRGKVKIERAEHKPVQTSVQDKNGNLHGGADYSEPNGHDFFVWLRDHAKITKDGYVANGVKVKIGLPIELEGFKYRAYGRIIDVEAIE